MLRRVLLTLFSLWFVAVLGDPGVLHSCPMHGAHGGHGPLAPTMDHSSHVHAGAEHHGKAPAGECTCMGHCCATAAAVHAPATASLVIPAAVAQTTTFPALVSAGVSRQPDHRLPFSNGPPNTPHVA